VVPHLLLFRTLVTFGCLQLSRAGLSFWPIEQSEGNNLFANQSWQRAAYISNVHSHRDVIFAFFLVSCLVENLISQLYLALCFIYDLDMLIRTFLQVFTIRLGVIFHISFFGSVKTWPKRLCGWGGWAGPGFRLPAGFTFCNLLARSLPLLEFSWPPPVP